MPAVLTHAATLLARQGPPLPPGPPRSAAYMAESNASHILALVGTFTILATITMVLRIYARKFLLKAIGADDIIMVLATICSIGIFIGLCVQAKHGMGRHIEAVDLGMQQAFQKIQFPISLMTITGVTLTKVAIALLLIRLFTDRMVIWFLWGFIALISAYALGSDISVILACVPTQAQWDFSLLNTAKCYPAQVFSSLGIANSAVTIVTDVILALLPIPVIWRLHTNVRTKVVLIGVMCLGLVACAAGAVKTHYQLTFLADRDRYYYSSVPVWGSLEISIAILAGNLPTLKPLFASFFAKISSTANYGSRTGQSRNTRGNTNASRTGTTNDRKNGNDAPEDEEGVKMNDTSVIVTEVTITPGTATQRSPS